MVSKHWNLFLSGVRPSSPALLRRRFLAWSAAWTLIVLAAAGLPRFRHWPLPVALGLGGFLIVALAVWLESQGVVVPGMGGMGFKLLTMVSMATGTRFAAPPDARAAGRAR